MTANADISLLRLDVLGQWPSIQSLESYVYGDFPDIFVLENAWDSLGGTFENDFCGYYNFYQLSYGCNIYYCSDRFEIVDQGEIVLPEKAEYSDTLRCNYIVLKDCMTFEEVVLLESDLSDKTLSLLTDVMDYVSFPNRKMIYLGEDVPKDLAKLLSVANNTNDENRLFTMINDGFSAVSSEDRTSDINEQQIAKVIEWNNKCESHMIVVRYK